MDRLLLAFIALFLVQCNSRDFFEDEIAKYGFIPYSVPLKYSGTGTLVGGGPTSMILVSSPESCFPDEYMENIRRFDETTLPTKTETIVVDTDVSFEMFQALQMSSPSVKAGTRIRDVRSIHLEFEGVHIEYLDSKELVDYYLGVMPETCKNFLDHVPFITEVIKVDKMKFSFSNTNEGHVYLDTDNITQYLDFDFDIKWKIENDTTLVIDSPKYICYQLGALRRVDEGYSLLRATEVKGGEWVFEDISIFKNEVFDMEEPQEFLSYDFEMRLRHAWDLRPFGED